MSLRTRLALVFIAATLIPLGATVWLTTLLLNQSLRLSPVNQLSDLSRSLEKTGKEYYQQARAQLKADALAGRLAPISVPHAARSALGAKTARVLRSPAKAATNCCTWPERRRG